MWSLSRKKIFDQEEALALVLALGVIETFATDVDPSAVPNIGAFKVRLGTIDGRTHDPKIIADGLFYIGDMAVSFNIAADPEWLSRRRRDDEPDPEREYVTVGVKLSLPSSNHRFKNRVYILAERQTIRSKWTYRCTGIEESWEELRDEVRRRLR